MVSSFWSCDMWTQSEAVGVSHSGTWHSGIILQRVYELIIKIIENYFSIILIPIILSGKNFAHVMSAELSWDVQ